MNCWRPSHAREQSHNHFSLRCPSCSTCLRCPLALLRSLQPDLSAQAISVMGSLPKRHLLMRLRNRPRAQTHKKHSAPAALSPAHTSYELAPALLRCRSLPLTGIHNHRTLPLGAWPCASRSACVLTVLIAILGACLVAHGSFSRVRQRRRTAAQQCSSTSAHQHISTSAHQHSSTATQQHSSTAAQQQTSCPGARGASCSGRDMSRPRHPPHFACYCSSTSACLLLY